MMKKKTFKKCSKQLLYVFYQTITICLRVSLCNTQKNLYKTHVFLVINHTDFVINQTNIKETILKHTNIHLYFFWKKTFFATCIMNDIAS